MDKHNTHESTAANINNSLCLGCLVNLTESVCRVADSGKGVPESDVEPRIVGFSSVVAHKAGLCDVVHARPFWWIAQCSDLSGHVVLESDVNSC